MRKALLLLFLLAWFGLARAAEEYPSRAVTLVVPFAPAGLPDLVGRAAAQALQQHFKQPVIVNNRGGAGGAIGYASVAAAKPDGYTLLLAVPSLSTMPLTQRLSGREVTYRLEQLSAVARITSFPQLMVARADGPWKTIQDLLRDAKARPNAISYGSSGLYGDVQLVVEALAQAAGVSFLHVPFQGTAPAVTAMLGGQVDFTNSLLQAPALIKAGKARAMVIYGPKRFPGFPDVPAAGELGYDIDFPTWIGLFVPAGTPAEVINRLREGMRRASSDESFKTAIASRGVPLEFLDAPEFSALIGAEAARLADMVNRISRQQQK